ncbi:MAG TPA: RNA methyltransferase, partial [Ramlibacter sp.]
MTAPAAVIRSAANPQLKALRQLAQDNTAWRKQGRIWLEGDHLCRAALARGIQPLTAVYAESCPDAQRLPAPATLVLDDALFASLSTLESPARMGFVIGVPDAGAVMADAPT